MRLRTLTLAVLAAGLLGASPGPRSALERLARDVAATVQQRADEAPVAVHVRTSAPELERAFSTLLCAELSGRGLGAVPLDAPTAEAAEPAARALGARSLVRVTLSLEHGLLHARGDLIGTWVNFWSGGVPTRPAAPAGAIARSTEADAHALALAAQPLPPLPAAPAAPARMQLIGAPLAQLPSPTAALATGDLDGDGTEEILALTDDEVVALSAYGRVLARRDHRGLPPSPTPCREPAGALAVYANPPRVAYLSSRRARGEVLEYDREQRAFRPTGPLEAAPLGGGERVMSGQLLPGQNAFAPEITLAGKGRLSVGAPFVTLSVSGAADGGAQGLLVHPNGSGARLPTLAPGAAAAEPLTGLGAGSALVDLDGDGRPEIATTSPQFAPDPDELRILDEAGRAVLWQGPVARGRALQVAGVTLEPGKPRGLVVGVWLPDGTAEIQLFRRLSP